MEARAFCPAHITGFFKAHLEDKHHALENLGSMGAGFSIKEGVTTRVKTDTKIIRNLVLELQPTGINQIKQMFRNMF